MRKHIEPILTAIVMIALAFAPIRAQESSRTIRQFQHTAWTTKDGAPPEIWALQQGPDGYLWLGTGSGLYRFDGVSFQRYPLVRGARLLSIDITALKVLPSNDVWVGYSLGGVSHLKDGRATSYTETDGIPSGMVVGFLQDRSGVLWVVAHNGLSRFQDGRWQRVGADWHMPADFVVSLFESRDGALWLSTDSSLYLARPQSHRFEPTGETARHATLAQTPDGRLWITDATQGLRPLPNYLAGDHRPLVVSRRASSDRALSLATLAVDRYGVIWGTDRVNAGIIRFNPLETRTSTYSLTASDVDVFRREDGLTAGRSIPMLHDREGNVWVGTSSGLNRFRRTEIVPEVAVPPATAHGFSIAALSDATYITDGVSIFRASALSGARRVARLPVVAHTVLLHRKDGALWYGNTGFMYRRHHNVTTRLAVPGEVRDRLVVAITEDRAGILWVAFERASVYQLRDGAWSEAVDLGGLPTPIIAASDPRGPIWFGYSGSRVSRHDASGMRIFSSRDGLDVGNVKAIAVLDGTVWVGGELGVARFDGTRFQTLSADRAAALFGLSGIGLAPNGDVLLNGLMGIARSTQKQLLAAIADSSIAPTYELYDRANGLPSAAQQGWNTPSVVPGTDGRIWFISNTGVSSLRPDGHERNVVPPAVFITSATTRSVVQPVADALTLPAGTTSVELAYDAVALRAPERLRFRHKLEGLDAEWSDVEGRRSVTYRNLRPGSFRFRVQAANEDGVWNEAGASLAIAIPRTFVQDWPIRVLLGLVIFAAVRFAYVQRMRFVADGIRRGMSERMEERERIARALHDTLLQSVQALTIHFQGALNTLPASLPSRGALEAAIDRADEVVAEGRDRILDLRPPPACTVEEMIDGVVKRQAFDPAVQVAVRSAGTPRDFDPVVLDEVARFAREAAFNIWRHASATRVEIHIGHGSPFTLRIIDDGVGLNPDVAERGARENHFGLPSMRETAATLRGTLTISRPSGGGTELCLVVPSSIAYRQRRRQIVTVGERA